MPKATGGITRPEERILHLFGRLHVLSADQVRRRFYGRSERYVEDRLASLAGRGYLLRLPYRPPGGRGRIGSLYAVNERTCRLLREDGQPAPERWRDAELLERTPGPLDHALAVNDVVIAVERLADELPALDIEEFRHERELKRSPLRVPAGAGKAAVVFDGWLDLRLRGERTRRLPIALEVDRGTERQKAFRTKVAGLVAAMGGAYQDAFGARSLTVAVVAAPPADRDGRAREILAWIEAELGERGATDVADLFCVTGADAATLGPGAFLLEPRWLAPFGGGPIPLLAPLEGGT